MRLEVKEHLINQYNNLKYKGHSTCLKYHYQYNNVNVNVYFDAYEPESLSLYLILVYESKYYYTALNIDDTSIRTEYLNKIPIEILTRILVDSHLTEFYSDMENHILSGKAIVNTYSKDKIFVGTMKYSKNKEDLPFWDGLRNVRMQDSTLYKLHASANITIEVLKQIQEKNFTLVRTANAERRKELTIILKPINIKLK